MIYGSALLQRSGTSTLANTQARNKSECSQRTANKEIGSLKRLQEITKIRNGARKGTRDLHTGSFDVTNCWYLSESKTRLVVAFLSVFKDVVRLRQYYSNQEIRRQEAEIVKKSCKISSNTESGQSAFVNGWRSPRFIARYLFVSKRSRTQQ